MSADPGAALAALAVHDPERGVRTVGLEGLQAFCLEHGLSLPQGARVAVNQALMPLPLLKNLHALSMADQAKLLHASVLLVGAGGLGGYALELLSRFGVGRITVADGDVFEESNLNSQLLSSADNLGQNKARAGAKRASRTSPLVSVEALDFFLDESNLCAALGDVDIVVDALGGIRFRRALRVAASQAGVPVVGAAVAGWTALVGSELPGQTGISTMWTGSDARDAERVLGSLAPAACLAASLQAAEAVQYLITGDLRLAGRMLHADLSSFAFTLYDLA